MAQPSRIALSLALILLASCRSDPVHFHTLIPTYVNERSGDEGMPILIESVSVPPQVDRSQIVIRQGSSGLLVLETEWWGASLVDELKSALVGELGLNQAQRKLSLRLDVQRFDSIPGHYARIEVV